MYTFILILSRMLQLLVWNAEVAPGGVLQKKLFLKFLQNSQENTFARIFIKKRLLHRCFVVNFPNFQEHLFYRTPPDYCWLEMVNKMKVY